jgi:hypothetical protein
MQVPFPNFCNLSSHLQPPEKSSFLLPLSGTCTFPTDSRAGEGIFAAFLEGLSEKLREFR